MKQVCVKRSTCSRTASTTRGAELPTLVTAMPDAKSIHSRPSTSVSVPPLAWSTYDVSTELTPRATAADRRLPSSSDDVISDLDVVHDVLDPGVVLETVHGQVLAVSGALEAAVRHLGDER